MRRTKDTLLNGKKILDLPPKVTNLASLQFELEERAIYAALEQRARIRVNKFIERGTLMKNYSVGIMYSSTDYRSCSNSLLVFASVLITHGCCVASLETWLERMTLLSRTMANWESIWRISVKMMLQNTDVPSASSDKVSSKPCTRSSRRGTSC